MLFLLSSFFPLFFPPFLVVKSNSRSAKMAKRAFVWMSKFSYSGSVGEVQLGPQIRKPAPSILPLLPLLVASPERQQASRGATCGGPGALAPFAEEVSLPFFPFSPVGVKVGRALPASRRDCGREGSFEASLLWRPKQMQRKQTSFPRYSKRRAVRQASPPTLLPPFFLSLSSG